MNLSCYTKHHKHPMKITKLHQNEFARLLNVSAKGFGCNSLKDFLVKTAELAPHRKPEDVINNCLIRGKVRIYVRDVLYPYLNHNNIYSFLRHLIKEEMA